MKNKIAKIAAVVALVGAGYVGASWWLGTLVQARYQALMGRAVAQVGVEHVTERHYDRGLLGAQSTMVLQFRWPHTAPGEKGDAQKAQEVGPERSIRVTLQDDIRHGPLAGWRLCAARVRTRIALVEGVDEATRQAFAKANWPEADTLVGFDGAYSGQALLPAGEATEPTAPGIRLAWQPLTYDYRGSAGGNQVEGSMQWPQVTMRLGDEAEAPDGAGAMQVQMDALQARFDFSVVGGQWLMAPGKSIGTIGAIKFDRQSPELAALQPLASFKDIRFETQTTRNAGLFDAVARATGQGRLGDIELKEVRYESAMNRLDAQGLAAAQKLLLRIVSGQPDADAVLEQEVEALARRLIEARPEYRDSFSVTLADGQVAKFAYGVAVGEKPADRPQALAGMPWQAGLVQRLQFDAALRLPKTLLSALGKMGSSPDVGHDALAMTADAAARRGWLREEDGAYVAQLDFNAGALQLNGKNFMGMPGGR